MICREVSGPRDFSMTAAVDVADEAQTDGEHHRGPLSLLAEDDARFVPISWEQRVDFSRSNVRGGEKSFERFVITLLLPCQNRLSGRLRSQRYGKCLSTSPFSPEPLYLAHSVLLI